MSLETLHAQHKYQGEVARTYEAKRQDSEKWRAERRIMREFLSDLPKDTHILDIPCGTGRWIEIFKEFEFRATGMDINEDMMRQAKAKGWCDVRQGNILYIPLGAKAVDVSLAIRLFNWLAPEDVQKAIRELQRVTRKRIIFTLRVAEHPRARPFSLVEAVLDGWKMVREEEIEGTFRMFMLEAP